jgi:transposase
MMHINTFVGLDVHARSIKAVALDVVTGEVRSAGFGYDHAAVAEWVRSLPQPAKCVYESGVTGFDLQKRLSEDGVDCVIGAVSKMIRPAADKRRKNDRNDAEFLARMLAVGNIVEVWVPDDECEAARDLTRALEDAREEVARSKQLLSKFLLRHGYVFDERTPTGQRKKNWTAAHWAWIRSISFAQKADGDVLDYYIGRAKQALEDKKRLDALVAAEASRPRWKKRVDSLRCLKGIEVATAADLVFEAGEFSRFKNARSFVAWVGLTPSEHSSGESERKGGITKAGNRHLRKALVEAAWHYLGASPRPKDLAKGKAPDPEARRHAAKGVRRLVERRESMLARGLQKNKANVATARELACWAWAVGRMAETA